MMIAAQSWIKDNSTLVYFLIAQALGLVGAIVTMTAYMTKLEARVNTLEVRGSPHLNTVDNRLTVLEAATKDNAGRLDRVITIMTKELHISPTRP